MRQQRDLGTPLMVLVKWYRGIRARRTIQGRFHPKAYETERSELELRVKDYGRVVSHPPARQQRAMSGKWTAMGQQAVRLATISRISARRRSKNGVRSDGLHGWGKPTQDSDRRMFLPGLCSLAGLGQD